MRGVRLNESSAPSNSNPCPTFLPRPRLCLPCGQCVHVSCVHSGMWDDFYAPPNLDIPDFRMPGAPASPVSSPLPFPCLSEVPSLAAGSDFAPGCPQGQGPAAPKHHVPHNRPSPFPGLGWRLQAQPSCTGLEPLTPPGQMGQHCPHTALPEPGTAWTALTGTHCSWDLPTLLYR